jgi:hypothetical protein
MRVLHACLGGAIATSLALWGCDPASPPGAADRETVERASSPPGPTLAQILRDEDAYARARALGALLPTLGAEALPEVQKALRNPMFAVGGVEYELLMQFWASHEPEAASRWAADWASTDHQKVALLAAFPYWVAADLQASLAAVDEWHTVRPELREVSIRALVLGWYRAGLPGLTEYIRDQGAGIQQQLALATYLRAAMAKEGTEAVTSWAEAVPEDDPAYKLTVYRQVASALPLFDREAATRWCEAHCDGPYGNNLRTIIAGRWVTEDGPGALSWLSTAPESHEKKLAVRVNFATWAAWNPGPALAWMEEQTRDRELPEWLEPVLPVYAVVLVEKSPAEAIEWAQRIEQKRAREITLIKVARRWRQLDEPAAEAWLESSPLSAESREEVRDPDPMWRPGRPKKQTPS